MANKSGRRSQKTPRHSFSGKIRVLPCGIFESALTVSKYIPMRLSLLCLLIFTLVVGCKNDSGKNAQTMSRNTDNTWTSDMLQDGNITAIQQRVLNDPDYVSERDYLGDSPLLTAVAFDNIKLGKFLLKHNSNPNVEVGDGYTCMLSAVESESDESIKIVAELIKAGADIHTSGINGWTPLHMAAARGQVEKAILLINAGADVNQRKEIDASETPLMEAAYMGRPSTVRLLLAHGADSSMRDTINNQTALEIAKNTAKGPDPDVIHYLKDEKIQIDSDELLSEIDLSADQLKMMKEAIEDLDMTQSYINNSNELVTNGNHAEVIRILTKTDDEQE